MNLKEIHNVYFIGIGGIGMSALAKYFCQTGKQVGGYDKTPTKITNDLESQEIEIHFNDSLEAIPEKYKNKTTTLIVYTPAIPKNHLGLNFFLNNGFHILKRAEVLGIITKNTFCFAVAGTHGKTTTSSILGHIMQPYNATSFLKLSPNIACITSMDADHLDIYGEHSALEASFQEFADKVSDTLIVAKGSKVKGITYAIDEDADYQIKNLLIKNGNYIFDVKTPTNTINEIVFSLPGKHNIMNALAALAMADCYGIPLENIKKSLETFKGVERRFSYKIKSEELILIDDYAHHPTEINAVYESVNEIYPARENPIEGVTSSWLLEKIANKNKKITHKLNLVKDIKNSAAKIVVMLGAGDIGMMVEDVKNQLITLEKV